MNILILTPIHPVQIVEMSQWLTQFRTNSDIYSPQMMALIGENVLKYDYITANYLFTLETRNHPDWIKVKNTNYPFHIVYGNVAKNSTLHFDHIIAFSSMDTEIFDPYLDEAIKTHYSAVDIPDRDKIQWYTAEEAHITLPTYHHLEVFLTTLGVKKNDKPTDGTETV